MPTVDPTNSVTPSEHVARHTARLDACWPHVRVEFVQVHPEAMGHRVRASVQLGGLTPADVRVELIPRMGSPATATASGELRMFSTQTLGNGCFVFEARIPHRDAPAVPEWLIHVHPSEALEEPRVEHPFRIGSGIP